MTEIRSVPPFSLGRDILSPAEKYRNEWKDLLSSVDGNLDSLRNLAFTGELKISKFRSVSWSLLLKVISDSSANWAEEKNQQRQKYKKLITEFSCNPRREGTYNDDPLSQSKQSVWNQYFGDQELFAVIKQDVVRTFPGVDFFRKPFIQEAMTNILFYYAREHPYICYRQGMHEILAPILFVMHCDHQALLHFIEVSSEIDELLLNVLDPKHLEADTYCIFSRLMSSIESYYRIANMVPTSEAYFPVQSELCEDISTSENEVIRQLTFIRNHILAKEDLHLHNHLLKLDIPLHLFGIRWLRLLFGREFPLQDLLMLWDAIFADSDRFELPNYITVAMLIRIREKLLLNDYTTCLTYLMKYPNNVDISLILRHALSMYMPKKYERPFNAFVYAQSALPKQHSLKDSKSTPKQSLADRIESRTRSTSLSGGEKNIPADAKISELQYKNALAQARLADRTVYQGPDVAIVDGYRVDSRQALLLELERAQQIITISRLKLQKFLAHLRIYNPSDSENDALDGIEEVCALLDVKFSITSTVLPQPVDQALEANETCQSKSKLTFVKNTSSASKPQYNLHNYLEPEIDRNSIDVLRIMKGRGEEETEVSRNPLEYNDQIANKIATRYEVPDNGYMNSYAQKLGSKKVVELELFRNEVVGDENQGGVPELDPTGLREN